jgi:hypothetical protein
MTRRRTQKGTDEPMTASNTNPTAIAPDAGFQVERWQASSGNDRNSRASLVLAGGNRRWHAHATGNGAVDALMRSVDEAVAQVVPFPVELITYDVHATGHGHAAAASVTLSIREAGADPDAPEFPGRATHPNVLEASLGAYLDAINVLVANHGIDLATAAPLGRGSRGKGAGEETEARTHAKDGMMDLYNP